MEKHRHSQYDEEDFVLKFFADKPVGFFLDIGANNGFKGSNSRGLAEVGWEGIMVEPDPSTFIHLLHGCKGSRVIPIWAAITDESGKESTKFHQHYEHNMTYQVPDSGNSQIKAVPGWKEVEVPLMTINDLRGFCYKPVSFLTVDAEYFDYHIIKSINFGWLKPDLLLFEYDVMPAEQQAELDKLLTGQGYKQVYESVGNRGYAFES